MSNPSVVRIIIIHRPRLGIGAEVPGGKRGQLVASDDFDLTGEGRYARPLYKLTSRVEGDLWRVKRIKTIQEIV